MILKKANIGKLIEGVNSGGGVFVAPTTLARQVVYKPVNSADVIEFDYIIPRNSFKEYLFPQTEVIADFAFTKEGVSLGGVSVEPPETVIFGARPCDSTSVASLNSVFTWDFVDEFYTRREDKAVVMTVACTKSDAECFCTTVGVKPDGPDGSDLLLKETEGGDFTVEAVTEKGKAFAEKHKGVFDDKGKADIKVKPITEPEMVEGVDMEKIQAWLKDTGNYGSSVWAEMAAKCVGCGACTYSCPTCHCFDLTDEGTFFEGERRKNWDACQFDHFTLHASGHNPRDTQYKRWRNRFMCKFNFYPNKFKQKGCVGCGRCVRVCAVRLDITEVMAEVSKSP